MLYGCKKKIFNTIASGLLWCQSLPPNPLSARGDAVPRRPKSRLELYCMVNILCTQPRCQLLEFATERSHKPGIALCFPIRIRASLGKPRVSATNAFLQMCPRYVSSRRESGSPSHSTRDRLDVENKIHTSAQTICWAHIRILNCIGLSRRTQHRYRVSRAS